MTRWEYAHLNQHNGHLGLDFSHRQHIELPKATTLYSVFRTLGDDGWEMISHTPAPIGGDSRTWFKRPMV